MSFVPIQQLAKLFESKLLETLVEDKEYEESEMSPNCKKALETLRDFLASGCTKYELITLWLVSYLNSEILANLYRFNPTYTDVRLVLTAAGALELFKFRLLFDDPEYHTYYQLMCDCAGVACKKDQVHILDYLVAEKGIKVGDVEIHAAWLHDSAKVYAKYSVQPDYKKCITRAYLLNKIKIARAYAKPDEKYNLQPVTFESVEQIKFHMDFSMDIDMPSIMERCYVICQTGEDTCILEYAADKQLIIDWVSIFIDACRYKNARVLCIAANHVDVFETVELMTSQDRDSALEFYNGLRLSVADKK